VHGRASRQCSIAVVLNSNQVASQVFQNLDRDPPNKKSADILAWSSCPTVTMFSSRFGRASGAASVRPCTEHSKLSSSDALSNLKKTAAAMHQEKENSKQSEQMWKEKLTQAEELAKNLETQLRDEKSSVCGLRSVVSESAQFKL
jgi:hypothetical protein